MTTAAVVFWLSSWTFVLGLTSWSFYRVLKAQVKKDNRPD